MRSSEGQCSCVVPEAGRRHVACMPDCLAVWHAQGQRGRGIVDLVSREHAQATDGHFTQLLKDGRACRRVCLLHLRVCTWPLSEDWAEAKGDTTPDAGLVLAMCSLSSQLSSASEAHP